MRQIMSHPDRILPPRFTPQNITEHHSTSANITQHQSVSLLFFKFVSINHPRSAVAFRFVSFVTFCKQAESDLPFDSPYQPPESSIQHPVPAKMLRLAGNVTTSFTTLTPKTYNIHAVGYDVTTCTPCAPPPSFILILIVILILIFPSLYRSPSRSLIFARIFCANAADGFCSRILPT